MKKIMISAIAIGYMCRDFLTHYNIVKTNFDRNWMTVIAICTSYLIIYYIGELISYIKDKKEGNAKRKSIQHENCDRKRMREEFQKQRQEFFESYFRRSQIAIVENKKTEN